MKDKRECIIIELDTHFDDVVMDDYVPSPYKRTREVKGVYLYLQRNVGTDNWENLVKDFCKEKLNYEESLEGKGSVRKACKLIQGNWLRFVKYVSKLKHDNDKKYIQPVGRAHTG